MDPFVRARSSFRDRPLSQLGADVLARARSGFRRGASAGRGGQAAARIKGIMLWPRREWPLIAEEPGNVADLYLRYIMPLAAIPPLCKLVAWSLLLSYMGFGAGLVAALSSYVLGLAGVAALALFASRAAPLFEGESSIAQAFKLVAYAATPGWIGGVFRLVPGLAVLSVLLSLYSIYLIYTGAQALMAVPEDRSLGYAATIVVATLLLLIAIAVVITGVGGIKMIGMV